MSLEYSWEVLANHLRTLLRFGEERSLYPSGIPEGIGSFR